MAIRAQVAGDSPLVRVDKVPREQKKRRHQGEHAKCAPRLIPDGQKTRGGLVLHAQEDELFFTDRLALLDKYITLAVGVKMFGDSVSRLVAKHRRDFGLVGKRGAGVDPVGHELKQGFARSRSGEGRDELAVHRSFRLDDALGNHVFPGHQVRRRIGSPTE